MNGFIDRIVAFIAGVSEGERIGANGVSSSDATLIAAWFVLNALFQLGTRAPAPDSAYLKAGFLGYAKGIRGRLLAGIATSELRCTGEQILVRCIHVVAK